MHIYRHGLRPAHWIALAALAIAAMPSMLACVRMDVTPKAIEDTTLPMMEPVVGDQPPVPLAKDPTKTYRVGPSDVIHAEVRKDPTLSIDYAVTDEGNIIVANIGPVQVADLTSDEIAKKLLTVLGDYIRFNKDELEKEVRVAVRGYHSKVVYVLGRVANPGPKVMRADMMTIQEAIYAAGLPTEDAAIQRTTVVSPDPKNPVTMQIDLADILYRGQTNKNMLLKPNDTVYVPARTGANLSDAIRQLLSPLQQIYDLKYKMDFSNSNSSNGSGKNN